jgi:tetratricopeptide (TPR) repeat protein
MKARAFGKLGQPEQKIKLIKKAIELDSNCAAYYRSLGAAQYKMKKYEKALKNHIKSLDI